MKNNILIAEFMGYKNVKTVDHYDTKRFKKGVCVLSVKDNRTTYHEYNSNWNQLIFAWHKLVSMIWSEGDDGDYMCEFLNDLYDDFNTKVGRNAPKEASELLVKGIKWYNQNTP